MRRAQTLEFHDIRLDDHGNVALVFEFHTPTRDAPSSPPLSKSGKISTTKSIKNSTQMAFGIWNDDNKIVKMLPRDSELFNVR